MSDVTTERPVVTVTERARATILGMRAAEPEPESLALRIEVVGIGGTGQEYSYELTFDRVADAAEDDAIGYSGDLAVLIPASSVDKLRGASLDEVDGTGLMLRNPNRPSPTMGTGELVLEGTVEERIRQLLDGEINPSLAAHGGFALLDRVEDDVAFMTMGGGCQGCGLAKLTLSEGIKATIEQRVPEIREVIDITDHASGENPFYEPNAK